MTSTVYTYVRGGYHEDSSEVLMIIMDGGQKAISRDMIPANLLILYAQS
jgi:hypothetical protein